MKIYSKGFSDESIDYIVERKLRAIITTEYAIVTSGKDERSHDELRECLEVLELSAEYISIFFSPEMLVPDLQYVLQSQQEKSNTDALIKEFEESFFTLITKLAESSGNLTRAEVIRLIWQRFSSGATTPYINVDEKEKEELLAQVVVSEDDQWINDKFVELILKYAIYLTCWEKVYGSLAVRRYNAKHLGKRVSQDDKEMGSMAHENTINNWFKHLLAEQETASDKKIPQVVKESFKKNISSDVTYSIEEKIYDQCKIQMDRNADSYRKFFYRSHDAHNRERVKATLYELVLFSNCFAYSWYLQFEKEKVVEFILDETEHIGDINDVIDFNTTAAVEIVLMNTIKVNQNINEDRDWVDMKMDKIATAVERANYLQLYIIPAALVLLEVNKYKDDIPVDKMLESLYNDEDVIAAVNDKAQQRKDSLMKKDGGTALGNLHIFASENKAILDVVNGETESDTTNTLVSRSKSNERNYWTQRKRGLSAYEVDGVKRANGLIKKYLEYIHYQNKVIRDCVREVINSIINSDVK